MVVITILARTRIKPQTQDAQFLTMVMACGDLVKKSQSAKDQTTCVTALVKCKLEFWTWLQTNSSTNPPVYTLTDLHH